MGYLDHYHKDDDEKAGKIRVADYHGRMADRHSEIRDEHDRKVGSGVGRDRDHDLIEDHDAARKAHQLAIDAHDTGYSDADMVSEVADHLSKRLKVTDEPEKEASIRDNITKAVKTAEDKPKARYDKDGVYQGVHTDKDYTKGIRKKPKSGLNKLGTGYDTKGD